MTNYLRGVPSDVWRRRRDATSRLIPGGDASYQPPVDGCDLILAIDSVIRHIAGPHISAAVEETGDGSAKQRS